LPHNFQARCVIFITTIKTKKDAILRPFPCSLLAFPYFVPNANPIFIPAANGIIRSANGMP
jgi:hypothetical protein